MENSAPAGEGAALGTITLSPPPSPTIEASGFKPFPNSPGSRAGLSRQLYDRPVPPPSALNSRVGWKIAVSGGYRLLRCLFLEIKEAAGVSGSPVPTRPSPSKGRKGLSSPWETRGLFHAWPGPGGRSSHCKHARVLIVSAPRETFHEPLRCDNPMHIPQPYVHEGVRGSGPVWGVPSDRLTHTSRDCPPAAATAPTSSRPGGSCLLKRSRIQTGSCKGWVPSPAPPGQPLAPWPGRAVLPPLLSQRDTAVSVSGFV